ncbi:DsbA family protein [Oscillatoria sp. FACHB-1407]|uniref:DsbA family protein n=1 Tax=Oscillatoria sp. FACHB-1407 TaxID=2692847 RepID=UPI0016845418|nr:thioredoxin domain-containing protein [Oscillatoria sp. FACHB-1407]MBD2463561.1 DsbA family protein [Oscillatoria sp. FACHB-1407]
MTYNYFNSFLAIPPSEHDHHHGLLNAAVVLVMYGDYECFQSATVYRLVKAAQQKLKASLGDHNSCFIFRHFPQLQIHPHAQRAAEAVEAAATQNQFWPMHEMLFIHQQELANGFLVEYAHRLGLDIPRFLQDLSEGIYVDRIITDIQSGYRSGIEAAPALFIKGVRYHERWTIEQLIAAIVAAIG